MIWYFLPLQGRIFQTGRPSNSMETSVVPWFSSGTDARDVCKPFCLRINLLPESAM